MTQSPAPQRLSDEQLAELLESAERFLTVLPAARMTRCFVLAAKELQERRSTTPAEIGRESLINECAKVIDARIADLQGQMAEHNKWGNWSNAAAVSDHIVELKRNATNIRALLSPAQAEGGEKDSSFSAKTRKSPITSGN